MRAEQWRQLLEHEAKRVETLKSLVKEVNELGAELMDMAAEKEHQYQRAQEAELERDEQAKHRADAEDCRDSLRAEVAQLHWQRDDLQARNTELVQERRAIKQKRDAMARLLSEAIRFARHFPDCVQYPCTCGYIEWRDKRDAAMAEL